MTIPADNKGANIAGAAPSTNTFTEILNKIDPAEDGVEIANAVHAMALFLDQQLESSAFNAPVIQHPRDVRVLTAGNYQIPVDVVAILIEASGGGGGGSGASTLGGNGGDTLVVNATAGINILAPGGFGGDPRGPNDARSAGARGGDFLTKSGAAGGATSSDTGHEGQSGGTVTRFLASDDVSGQTLNITYGARGARAGNGTTAGQPGYVKITIW